VPELLTRRDTVEQHLRSDEDERGCKPGRDAEDDQPVTSAPVVLVTLASVSAPATWETRAPTSIARKSEVLLDGTGDQAGGGEGEAERRSDDRDGQWRRFARKRRSPC
jgi:hypothetical protein